MKRIAAMFVFFAWLGGGCSTPPSQPPKPPSSIVILPNAAGGTIEGLVTLGGAALPGATVTLTPDGSRSSYTAISDQHGRFRFRNVSPGSYNVRGELAGLQTITRKTKVTAVYGAAIELPMRLGSVAESITVTSSAPGIVMGSAPAPAPQPVISGAPGYDKLYMVDGAAVNENLRIVSAEYGGYTGGVAGAPQVTAVTKSQGGSNRR